MPLTMIIYYYSLSVPPRTIKWNAMNRVKILVDKGGKQLIPNVNIIVKGFCRFNIFQILRNKLKPVSNFISAVFLYPY